MENKPVQFKIDRDYLTTTLNILENTESEAFFNLLKSYESETFFTKIFYPTIVIYGQPDELYSFLFDVSKTFDIEIM